MVRSAQNLTSLKVVVLKISGNSVHRVRSASVRLLTVEFVSVSHRPSIRERFEIVSIHIAGSVT